MRALSATITLGLLLTVGVGGAVADSECVQEAKGQRGQCHMDCDEDFVIARDLCRNLDPECTARCRGALAECRAPIVTAFEGCVDGCRERLNADRAACPRRGRGHDFCHDHAQVGASLCRDECRENLQVRAGLNACRQAFNTCMNGCGLPVEPTPVPTRAPAVPTAVKTEPPPAVPTAVKTELPLPAPTQVPTEPPPVPTPTRTATPRPQPTATILQPS